MTASPEAEIYPGLDVEISRRVAEIVGIQIYTHQEYREFWAAAENKEPPWPCIVDYREHQGMTVHYHYGDGDFQFNLFKTLDDDITPHPDADASAAVVRRKLREIGAGTSIDIFPGGSVSVFLTPAFGQANHPDNDYIALVLAVLRMRKPGACDKGGECDYTDGFTCSKCGRTVL